MGLVYTGIMDHQTENAFDGPELKFSVIIDDNVNTRYIGNYHEGFDYAHLGFAIDEKKDFILLIEVDIDLIMIRVYYIESKPFSWEDFKQKTADVPPDLMFRRSGKGTEIKVFGGYHGHEELKENDGQPDLAKEYESPEDVYAEQGVGFD